MIARIFLELLGLLMTGEGLVALVHPRKYLKLWRIGPEPCKQVVDDLVKRPELCRALAVLELAAGLWLALWVTEDR